MRRKFERFSLELPVTLDVVSTGLKKKSFKLLTSNVSAGGAFFYTEEPIARDTSVRARVIIRCDRLTEISGAQGHVRVEGKVVRSEPKGMAIRFKEKYQFVSLRTR